MSHTAPSLSSDELLRILSLSENATAVYTTERIIIESANDAMLRFWRKDKSVIGLSFEEAIPELKSQPFYHLLQNVWRTGTTFETRNAAAELLVDGKLQTSYFDFAYRAIKNDAGETYAILHTATDVSDRVLTSQQVGQVEERLQLAIDSVGMGTWFLNTETRKMTASLRLKELLGFYPNEEISFVAAIEQIDKNYQQKVIDAVEATISNGGNFNMEYPIIGYRDKKFRWLRATGKLYNSGTEKAPQFSGTVLDITDSKLEDQRKDDFISIASHELKSPLTSLKGALQLLDSIKEKPVDGMMVWLINQCNRSMDKVTALIDELLNASRISQGHLLLNKTTFTIAEMLNSCCSHIRMAGTHELILQGDENLQLYADEHRIDQVVVNFINNAVKYAPESRKIYLVAERLDNMIKVSVKDAGPGISPEMLPHLFSRYYRVNVDGNQYSGLGLGLYISAEIIKHHGGEIGVDSELGKGSTFWFTLPVK